MSDWQETRRPASRDVRRLEATRDIDAVCDEYDRLTSDAEPPPFVPWLERVSPELRDRLLGELAGIALERFLSRVERSEEAADRVRGLGEGLTEELALRLEERLASELTAPHAPPVSGSRRTRRSRGLRLQCPHCSNHVELVGDTPDEAVECTSCGSHFSLVDRARETRGAPTLDRIDRFELVSRLGIGAFGTVWKARDTELERAVAVKIPRSGQLSPNEIDQFLREARSAAQLSHPHIVPVHEVGRQGDTIYIVSDLVRGVSLADYLTGEQPTQREAAELCATIADALDHAHSRGVVHRDLKPSNVMLDDHGAPHLMDFGLAKREVEEVTMTTEGQILGTPAYMSPEQAGGRSAWADRRTDVYSLGVMLFELLTGELPFRGNAQMQLQRRQTEDAPNARTLNRGIPIDLATIAAKCLEREPGRRYPTAAAAADDLRCYLQRRPIQARPLSRPQRLARWCARNPYQAAVGGLIALLAVAGPSVAVVLEQRRARLAAVVAEKDELIERRNEDARVSRAANAELSSQLSVLRGEVDSWAFWPPESALPPKKRMLQSLLADREAALVASGAGVEEEDLQVAQRFLTLAILYEAAGRVGESAESLRAASAPLKRLHAARPRSLPIAAELLAVYAGLSRLAEGQEEADRWRDEWLAMHRRLADEFPRAALVQAGRLDADLRVALSAGASSAGEALEDAKRAEERLDRLWPELVADLYRVACGLAGRPTPLLEARSTEAD